LQQALCECLIHRGAPDVPKRMPGMTEKKVQCIDLCPQIVLLLRVRILPCASLVLAQANRLVGRKTALMGESPFCSLKLSQMYRAPCLTADTVRGRNMPKE